MCGRFAQVINQDKMIEDFKIDDFLSSINPEFNLAPSSNIIVLVEQNEKNVLKKFYWDLIPYYTKSLKSKYKLHNIRRETLLNKNSFKDQFQHKRCLIPASGYYEWSKRKVPHYFYPENRTEKDKEKNYAYFLFAGVWDSWINSKGKIIHSCAILTQEATGQSKNIHSRMPVILNKEDSKIWLKEKTEFSKLKNLLAYHDSTSSIQYHPVSKIVGSIKNNSVSCIEPYYEETLFHD